MQAWLPTQAAQRRRVGHQCGRSRAISLANAVSRSKSHGGASRDGSTGNTRSAEYLDDLPRLAALNLANAEAIALLGVVQTALVGRRGRRGRRGTGHDICRNVACAANTSRCGVQMNGCPPAQSTLRLCSAQKKIRRFWGPWRQNLEVGWRRAGTKSAPLALPTPCESPPGPLKTSAASPLPLLHCHAQETKTPGLWRFLPAWRDAGLA